MNLWLRKRPGWAPSLFTLDFSHILLLSSPPGFLACLLVLAPPCQLSQQVGCYLCAAHVKRCPSSTAQGQPPKEGFDLVLLLPSGFCSTQQLCLKRKSEVAQLCPTLFHPTDCSPPGSSIHGILQARVPEWVAISFSRGSSRPRDRTWVSRIVGRRFTV